MKKILFIAMALFLAMGQVVCFADVQIDEGQQKGTAAVKFFIGRNARQTVISADRIVIWDSTSKDGVTVTTTTTSGDRLVAGITIDSIPGVTSDVAATSDTAFNNWGRIQTWGLHEDVYYATGTAASAGANVCSSSTAGAGTNCDITTGTTLSSDNVSAGVALAADASNAVDMMVTLD